MKSIEKSFSDNEGNHLLVALDFYDDDYKQNVLEIPEQYADIDVVDINIAKAFLDKPIHFSAFFRMASWLLQQFNENENAVFTYTCSTEELATNHLDIEPQYYRWRLFDVLLQRMPAKTYLTTQDVNIGPEGFQSYGRAFYRTKHAPIIYIVKAHLREKYP